MSYEIRFEQKDTYLHATVTGTNGRDNVLAYMADISRECDRRQCFRVLIEMNPQHLEEELATDALPVLDSIFTSLPEVRIAFTVFH